MKSYVITILQNEKSVEVAQRCVESAKRFGVNVQTFPAITPSSDLKSLVQHNAIDTTGFVEIYSRPANCVAAFLSHFTLWKLAVKKNEEVQIFEHDAVVLGPLPGDNLMHQGCISLGKPSYGKWNTPATLGVNPLTSKRYFPGAHAYRVTPSGAAKLIQHAQSGGAGPTDVFLNNTAFPWLQEYYPWPVEAWDSFTTIQNDNGIKAKHTKVPVGKTYEIL